MIPVAPALTMATGDIIFLVVIAVIAVIVLGGLQWVANRDSK